MTIVFKQTKLTEWVAAKLYKVNHHSNLAYLLSAENCSEEKQAGIPSDYT